VPPPLFWRGGREVRLECTSERGNKSQIELKKLTKKFDLNELYAEF